MNNSELISLIEQGFTAEDIAKSLGYDVDAVNLVIDNHKAKKSSEVNINDLINKYRPAMIKVLVDIAETGENESARVAAARVIVEGKGTIPDMNVDQWSEKFAKIKAITDKGREKAKNRINNSSDACLIENGSACLAA